MILTIECLDMEIKDLSETLENVKAEVIKKFGVSKAEAAQAEHRDILNNLQAEIIKRKRRKFQCDSRDYETGQVYTWREERNRQHPRRSSDGLPAYPNTEEEGLLSYREIQPFLGAGPNYQHTAARKMNPRLPIAREAYPQRQKNCNFGNKR
ncbi:hypothetical protein XELAEV_18031495mg [Xenopus laevis]|uniref:Uncharacterized protein n=1 Tax=Xenopus laevis TaxID=8355 RepID=A0A974CPC3_XENLA|nr:hypothetical protein XELAEV_18031495mg [Xenopus laevis]